MDARLKSDLTRLVATRPEVAPLPAATPRTPIADAVSLGRRSAAASQAAGIASPLIETAYEDRTWYAEEILTSSDGIFSFRIKRLHSLSMLDATGAAVALQFAEPAP